MMLLTQGRPADKRTPNEEKTYDFLDKTGVSYGRVDHEEAGHMEICNEIEKVLLAPICKNLFLCNRQQTEFYLLMMPGEKVFHTKDLSAQIQSSRLSFATPELMRELLDLTPGSVSVFGLLQDGEHRVQLLIDGDLLKNEFIGCHPCLNTSTLRIATKDLTEKILPALRYYPRIVKL